MTNGEIILRESIRLMQSGILHGTGEFVQITNGNGEETSIELPEKIHTFAAWKAAGYIVKRGQHAVACFPVWKYTERRNGRTEETEADENGETARHGHMYLRKAYFFTREQVEKITA